MIRLLIIDDSPTVRSQLSALFNAAPGLQVVGELASAEGVVQAVEKLRPDLVTLDVYMPRQRAAEVVRAIVSTHPVPIVLLSDATRSAEEVGEALAAGALDFVRKPRPDDAAGIARLLETLKALSEIQVRRRPTAPGKQRRVKVVLVGSSAGGPVALRTLLASLPQDFPAPVLVAQHFAPGFEDGLVDWLGQACPLRVRLAHPETLFAAGDVIVARPGFDMLIHGWGKASLRPAGPRGFHPSVNDLFSSAAATYRGSALGVVLSGMGDDGCLGARALVEAGGVVVAQDQQTSAIFGMPAAVTRSGLTSLTGSPATLGQALRELTSLHADEHHRPSN